MRKEFLDLCSQQIGCYGEQWLTLTKSGWETDELLTKLEDLILGVEVLVAQPDAPSPFTAQLVAGLTARHLMCTPLSPFTAVPFCLEVGNGSTTPQHNALSGLQRVGTGSGYYHLSEELALKVLAFFTDVVTTVPTVPEDVMAVATSNSITVSWQAPLSDGGSQLLRYELLRNNVPLTTISFSSGLLSYIDTAVVANVAYTYAVRAVNAVGNGPFTTINPVSLPTTTAPGAPVIGAATAGNATVSFSWTAPTSTGGSVITGYKVYRNGTLLTSLGNVLTYTDTTVTNGTSYTYRVTASNSVGESALSGSVECIPVAPTPPSFSQTLAGEGNSTYPSAVDTLTWGSAPTIMLKYNNPVQLQASSPGANVMAVFYPAGTQIAQLNYDTLDEGHACAVVIGGTTYYTTAAGTSLTFTNGNVTLA